MNSDAFLRGFFEKIGSTRLAKMLKAKALSENALKSKGVTTASEFLQKPYARHARRAQDIQETLAGGKESWRNMMLGEEPRKLKPLEEAMAREQLRRHASGRHALRPGEISVPSSHVVAGPGNADSYQIATKPSRKFVFRGNRPPRDKNDPWWASRHPDVAGSYAANPMNAMTFASKNQKVYAFKRKQLNPIYEGPEGTYMPPGKGADPKDVQRGIDYFKEHGPQKEPSKARESAGLTDANSPTYEMMVQQQRPRPVGVYSVRQSRTSSGDPSLAFRPIGKRSRRDIFEGTSKS